MRHGLAMTGRVVTAAAIIMIAVFGAFAIGNERALAMMGVGFAAAIFIDAFIIRLLLLPAVMHLAGPAMWWMPEWLDKRLPHLHIEARSTPRATTSPPWNLSANGRRYRARGARMAGPHGPAIGSTPRWVSVAPLPPRKVAGRTTTARRLHTMGRRDHRHGVRAEEGRDHQADLSSSA